jgi:hypothetical protein
MTSNMNQLRYCISKSAFINPSIKNTANVGVPSTITENKHIIHVYLLKYDKN